MNLDDVIANDDLVIDEISLLAKDVVITFLDLVLKKNKDSKFDIEKLKKHLDSYKFDKGKSMGGVIANCETANKIIKIRPKFTEGYYDEQLVDIVHEYFHAASSFISDIELTTVIEEGMAEALSEIALNYYFKKNKITEDHDFEQNESNYKACADLVKTLLAILEKDGKDYEFIYKYFFCHKEKCYEYFLETFGDYGKDFLVHLSYIDPASEKNDSASIRQEIDKAFSTTIKPRLNMNPDEIIEKSSRKGLSGYYYHNLLLERHAFQELSSHYMQTLTFENFVKLLKRTKPMTRSSHFNSPDLDSLLSVFYFPNMDEFSEVLSYVKKLPQMIGADLLEKTLPCSRNKMETILKYADVIRDFDEISRSYLKYYSKDGDKKTKFDFLLKTMDINESYPSHYYYELISNSSDKMTGREKDKVGALLIKFLEENIFSTDQEATLKVIARLPKYTAKDYPLLYKRVERIYGAIQKEMLLLMTASSSVDNIRVKKLDTKNLEMDLESTGPGAFGSLYAFAYSEDIIYLKNYFISLLDKFIEKKDRKK